MAFQLSETLKPALDVTAADLIDQVQHAGNIRVYLEEIDKNYYDKPIHDILAGLSVFVETEPPRNKTAPSAEAFMRGSILGLRTVELALGSSIVQELAAVEWFTKHNERLPEIDSADAAETISRLLRGMGYAGFRVADAFHPALEEWDIEATQNAATTRIFKDGFGFPIFHAQRLTDKQANDDIFAAIMTGSGIFADLESDGQPE